MKPSFALILVLLFSGIAQAQDDVANVPAQDLKVAGNEKQRYFLIGEAPKAQPKDGLGLLIVLPGDDIAGAAMAYHFDTGGWIRSLAVRRPWRKQGLGLALLYDVFGKMYALGEHRVGLGVDAESLTGATRLYERAGMRVKHHYARYRKTVQ